MVAETWLVLSEGKRGPVDEGGEGAGAGAGVHQSNLLVEDNRSLFHRWL